MRKLLALLLVLALPFALLAHSFSAAPLPAPPPYAGEWPVSSPPETMTILQLPTGITHRNGAFGFRGGSFSDKRDFAMTATLVRHPKGDLLIDTGFGSRIDEHVATLPWLFRKTAAYVAGKPAAAQLDEADYDRKWIRAIVLTHAHWDHISGVADFPGTPVLVNANEEAFIRDGGFIMNPARTITDAKYQEYKFDGGPYLGFPASHDIYDDGSVVLVPAPGHTPGSVIVFVNLPGEKHYAFVGDLVWQLEGITEREERAWPLRRLVDVNEDEVRENLLRMVALAEKFPDLIIVPAHDARAFETLPVVSHRTVFPPIRWNPASARRGSHPKPGLQKFAEMEEQLKRKR